MNLQFLFDFGSPNAYLAHRVIPVIEARSGAHFEYVPILLGGLFKLSNNRSPAEAFSAIPNKIAYEHLEVKRFIERHALLSFRMNPHFPVNTLQLMRGAVAAQRLDCFAPYIELVFSGMWEQGLKLDDITVVGKLLAGGGLDAERLLTESQNADVKAALLANTELAHARGAFGAPTFFVDDQMFFGKERLGDVEQEIARRASFR